MVLPPSTSFLIFLGGYSTCLGSWHSGKLAIKDFFQHSAGERGWSKRHIKKKATLSLFLFSFSFSFSKVHHPQPHTLPKVTKYSFPHSSSTRPLFSFKNRSVLLFPTAAAAIVTLLPPSMTKALGTHAHTHTRSHITRPHALQTPTHSHCSTLRHKEEMLSVIVLALVLAPPFPSLSFSSSSSLQDAIHTHTRTHTHIHTHTPSLVVPLLSDALSCLALNPHPHPSSSSFVLGSDGASRPCVTRLGGARLGQAAD